MFRAFTIFGILASLAAANVAHAGWSNGTSLNGLGTNGMSLNGLGTNGVDPNGMSLNGLGTNGVKENGLEGSPALTIQAFELPAETR